LDIRARITNLGIELGIGPEGAWPPLSPDPNADQVNPRNQYVYSHEAPDGTVFYVGKGTGRRAWSRYRHPLWERYVEKHLGGQFEVRILHDGLSGTEAERLEAEWIAEHSATLLNWANMGRECDYEANARFHTLRNANRALVQNTKAIEKDNPEAAVKAYLTAIEAVRDYAFIRDESGLVGELLAEVDDERGVTGYLEALDRLTLCLVRLGRAEEAMSHAQKYFAEYRLDRGLKGAERIALRLQRALGQSAAKNRDTFRQP
jgi:hypothetical protein